MPLESINDVFEPAEGRERSMAAWSSESGSKLLRRKGKKVYDSGVTSKKRARGPVVAGIN